MNTKDVTPSRAYYASPNTPQPVLLLNQDAPIEQRLALAEWLLLGVHSTAELASTSLASDGELLDILRGMLPAIEIALSLMELASQRTPGGVL